MMAHARTVAALDVASSPLLGLAESAVRARPLRHWTTAQRAALAARFTALHQAWATDWLPADDGAGAAPVEAEVVDLAPTAEDLACWSFDGTTAAVDALAERMFGFTLGSSRPEHASLAVAMVRAAWADWRTRLARMPVELPADPGAPLSQEGSAIVNPWSGGLCVRWRWCGGTWSLGLPQPTVAAVLGADDHPPPMAAVSPEAAVKHSLDHVLSHESIALQVWLDGTELSLGQLQALQPGDVVPLAHPLDRPGRITTPDGTTLCGGWLGHSEGRIAVSLARPPAPPSHPSVKDSKP